MYAHRYGCARTDEDFKQVSIAVLGWSSFTYTLHNSNTLTTCFGMDHMNTVLGVILYMCKYLYMSTADSRWQENAVGVAIQTLAALPITLASRRMQHHRLMLVPLTSITLGTHSHPSNTHPISTLTHPHMNAYLCFYIHPRPVIFRTDHRLLPQ